MSCTLPALGLLAVAAISACADDPVAPYQGADTPTCTVSASLALSSSNLGWSADEVAPVITDAATRPAESLGSDAAGTEVQNAMQHLATVWTATPSARCSAVNRAADALAMLPEDPATDADRAAVQLALNLAASVLTTSTQQ